MLYAFHVLDSLVAHVPSRKIILDDLGIGSGDAVSAAFCVLNGCSAPVLLCKEGVNIFFVDSCFLEGLMADEAK
jgi:hypothetical protein